MKLSFKNHCPEGRYRSFGHIYSDIKADGKQVGVIQYSTSTNAMRVILHVKDAPNFRNITLKKTFPTIYNERGAINSAKLWIKEHWEDITKLYDLYLLE